MEPDRCVICGEFIDYCQGHPGAWHEVVSVICDDAAPEVRDRVVDLLVSGRARWYWDPEVDRVAGLIKPGTNQAYVVVYLTSENFVFADFECSADFWEQEVDEDA